MSEHIITEEEAKRERLRRYRAEDFMRHSLQLQFGFTKNETDEIMREEKLKSFFRNHVERLAKKNQKLSNFAPQISVREDVDISRIASEIEKHLRKAVDSTSSSI